MKIVLPWAAANVASGPAAMARARMPIQKALQLMVTASLLRVMVYPEVESPGSRRWSGPRSREPALSASVVLDVPVALPVADTGEPQVELLHVLVLADGPCVAVQHDPAALHHVGVLGEVERHGGVLLGQQHGHLLLAVQAADDAEDLLHQHRGQAHGRLVEQHEPGPRHERPS